MTKMTALNLSKQIWFHQLTNVSLFLKIIQESYHRDLINSSFTMWDFFQGQMLVLVKGLDLKRGDL